MSSVPFSQLVLSLDSAIGNTFTDFPVTIHPRGTTGLADYSISVIQVADQFRDDFVPGLTPNVSILHLFVPSSTYTVLVAQPQKGDTVTLNAADYDLYEAPVDRMGGVVLKLRKRSAPWNA